MTTRETYDAFAPYYDDFTAHHQYEPWTRTLEGLARDAGLSGRRLLDVGCGTGKSFMPMLERGYEVTACDLSPAMVEHARAASGGGADVLVADMRDLPVLGRFDLVTCLDDAFNYLLTDEELEAAFEGIARNLRPGGLLVFDLNTLAGYRHYAAGAMAMDVDGVFFCLRGDGDPDAVEPGAVVRSVIEVFASRDGTSWERSSSEHVQRHHPADVVERLMARAGLELLERRGQVTGSQLDPGGDEDVHQKLDYFARRLPGATPTAGRR
jgi:SAM-dependent methyltransferase